MSAKIVEPILLALNMHAESRNEVMWPGQGQKKSNRGYCADGR